MPEDYNTFQTPEELVFGSERVRLQPGPIVPGPAQDPPAAAADGCPAVVDQVAEAPQPPAYALPVFGTAPKSNKGKSTTHAPRGRREG